MTLKIFFIAVKWEKTVGEWMKSACMYELGEGAGRGVL